MAKLHQNIKRFIQNNKGPFSMVKVSFSEYTYHILLIEACDAIRPEFNYFISMIIFVDTLCGFAPLLNSRFLGKSVVAFWS